MSNLLRTLLFGVVLALMGCEPHQGSQIDQVVLQEKVLPHPNPTNFEFDVSASDVKAAIKRAFDKWREEQTRKYGREVWRGGGDDNAKHILSQTLQLSGMVHLLWKGDGDALANNLLTKTGNENDAYLVGMEAPYGESQVYFKDGQPLIYFADFHIHLAPVGPLKTRVDIFTYKSSVVAGVDESWSPHGPSLIVVKVDPTTVEQYQILVGIGEQLGTKDLPQLVMAEPGATVKELTLPRER